MSVYVDNARNKFRRMLMCHMSADSEVELHAMAKHIGIANRHYQNHGAHFHYDICQSKRKLAIAQGAVAVSTRELAVRARALAGGANE